MADDIEARTIAQVARRFIPFLILCYFVAYLDRVNVGFAKLTMDADLGLSETAFGFGAGVFFLAYFLFEVPSNIIMDKVGARVWIARIMLSWGVISGAMAFIPNIAAGDGDQRRTHVLSAAHPARLRGGRVLSRHHLFPDPVVPRLLPGAHRRLFHGRDSALVGDRLAGLGGAARPRRRRGPAGAGSGSSSSRRCLRSFSPSSPSSTSPTARRRRTGWPTMSASWLKRRLARRGRAARARLARRACSRASPTPRVLALSLVYFGNVACVYGVGFWLPTIVKGFGLSIAMTGWVNAIPYVVGFLGMVWWGLRSDRKGERTMHLAVSLALAAIGIGASAFLTDPTTKMIALTVGAFGVYASLPIFWTLPTAFLAGAAVAPGIAAINSIGNLSGYFGPFAIGWIKDATGSFAWGLATIAACAVVALVITLALGHDPHLERAPEAAE